MKILQAAALAALLFAVPAWAQESNQSAGSTATLTHTATGATTPTIHVDTGAITVEGKANRIRFVYLPVLPQLPGTAFTTTRETVDPFVLTGTEFATTPRTFAPRALRAGFKPSTFNLYVPVPRR